jgi:hypothetical protein
MTYGISCSTLPDNVKLYLKPVLFSACVMKHKLVDVDGKLEICLKCGSRSRIRLFDNELFANPDRATAFSPTTANKHCSLCFGCMRSIMIEEG